MKWLSWLITVVLLMVGGPMIALIVDVNATMLVFMALFFVLDPLCALYSGVFAGSDVKKRWSLPLVTVALFVLGAWWLLSMDAQGLLVYGGIYLVVGYTAMGVCAAILNKKNKNAT